MQGQREAKEEWVDMRDLEQGRHASRGGRRPGRGHQGDAKGWAQGQPGWLGWAQGQVRVWVTGKTELRKWGWRLGREFIGSQAMGSPTWGLCVQRGSGSQGEGTGRERQQRSAGAWCRVGCLPVPRSCRWAADTPRSCSYGALGSSTLTRLFAGKGPSLLTALCVWPRPVHGRLLVTPMNR